jgi:hypothetical protein
MTQEDWRKIGFDEVVEIEHNRLYHIRGTDKEKVARSFRLFIGQVIVGGHTQQWASSIDEMVDIGGRWVWTSFHVLQPCYNDQDAQFCLDDAAPALAAHLGLGRN